MMWVKRMCRYIIVGMVASALLGVGSLQPSFSQPPPGTQPPTAESLNYRAAVRERDGGEVRFGTFPEPAHDG